MNATTIKRVNTRLAANTSSAKLVPLEIGSAVKIRRLEFGEMYRGENLWFVDEKDNKYWSGGFAAANRNLSKSSLFNEFDISGLWKYATGSNIKIGIIDCGIIREHKAIVNSKLKVLNEGNPNCMHGTYMTSIIAGTDVANGYVGVLPDTQVLFYGYGEIAQLTPNVLMSILQQLEDADIISMSFAVRKTFFFPLNKEAKALNDYLATQVTTNNKIILASTGNDGRHFSFYPAAYDGVLSVSALQTANSSNVEPNANIWDGVQMAGNWKSFFDLNENASTDFPGLGSLSGTSPAAAVLAALAGFAKSKRPGLATSGFLQECCSSTVLFSESDQKSYSVNLLDKGKFLKLIKT